MKKLKAKDYVRMGAAYALTPQAQQLMQSTNTLGCLAINSIICGDGYLVPMPNQPDKLVPLKGVITKKMAKKIANEILKARKSAD